MESKIVKWDGDYDSQEESSDFFGTDPKEEESEPFTQIVKRARAKIRDNEPLSPKEKWAFKHASKDPSIYSKTGPRKQTLKAIENIVKLQLEEGLSYSQIAQRLEKSETTIAHLVSRYPNEYRKALDKVQKDLLEQAGVVKTVVYARIINLMQRLALRAPVVLEEIMEDTQQPGGVRLDAVKTAIKTYGVGEKSSADQQVKTHLNAEQVQLIKDTIGIFNKLQEEVKPIHETTAEIIDASGEVL